jgi:hypothetical protein
LKKNPLLHHNMFHTLTRIRRLIFPSRIEYVLDRVHERIGDGGGFIDFKIDNIYMDKCYEHYIRSPNPSIQSQLKKMIQTWHDLSVDSFIEAMKNEFHVHHHKMNHGCGVWNGVHMSILTVYVKRKNGDFFIVQLYNRLADKNSSGQVLPFRGCVHRIQEYPDCTSCQDKLNACVVCRQCRSCLHLSVPFCQTCFSCSSHCSCHGMEVMIIYLLHRKRNLPMDIVRLLCEYI